MPRVIPSSTSRSERGSFERFYLTKVALGDCCGCAERVIDWRDIEYAAAASELRNEGAVVQHSASRWGRMTALIKKSIRQMRFTSTASS